MNKQKLLEKIQDIDKKEITFKLIYDIYEDDYLYNYMNKLKRNIERIFGLDDLRNESRKTEYVIARSLFIYLAHKRGVMNKYYSEFLNMSHCNATHALKMFYVYEKSYPNYNNKIMQVLKLFSSKNK